MLEFLRACREIDPEWVVGENVPGLLSSHGGRDFQTLLDAVAILWPDGGAAWRVLDAQFARVPVRDGDGRVAGWFGPVAQRRRRLFLVVNTRDWRRAAAVLFEPDCLRGGNPSSKQKREELARAAGRGSAAGGSAGFCGYASHTASSIGYQEEQAPTLKGNDWQCQVPDVLQRTKHAVCLQTDHLSQNGTNAHVEVCKTLDTQGPPAVCQAFAQSQFGNEIAGTLTHRADSSPCSDRGQNIVCMAHTHTNAEIGMNLPPTLTAHASKDAPVLFASNGDEVVGEGTADEMAVTIHDGSRWVVRRLMPVECERLQGFPDHYTDIPYKGKEHPPNTPRYKALGNSMAVPVMRWIGERMQMVDSIINELSEEK